MRACWLKLEFAVLLAVTVVGLVQAARFVWSTLVALL